MDLMERFQGFTQLVDGSFYSVVESASSLEMVLPDGRRERLELKGTCPTEFTVKPSVLEADGTTRLDVEILKFEVAGTSQILWPGQRVVMAGGRNCGPEALPIYGTVRIPAGKTLEDGAYSEQLVFVQVDCPEGKLHNLDPVRMAAVIDCIPPKHLFKSIEERTVLYDNTGVSTVAMAACGSVTGG